MSNEEKWRKDDVFEWNQINMSWNEKGEKFNSRRGNNSSWMNVFIESNRTKKIKNRRKIRKEEWKIEEESEEVWMIEEGKMMILIRTLCYITFMVSQSSALVSSVSNQQQQQGGGEADQSSWDQWWTYDGISGKTLFLSLLPFEF